MELKIGKMTSREIAKWLGISYNTYRNDIDKYLEKVAFFADFEKVYGGIMIKEIYISIYDRTLIKNTDKTFLQEVSSCNENLAAISGIVRKYKGRQNEHTIRRQFTKSRDRLFGATDNSGKSNGIAGSREEVWAIKEDDFNYYRSFTKEEEEIFDSLILSVYGAADVDKIKWSALLDKIYQESDTMTKEEYFDLREQNGCNFFSNVIMKFKELTGLQVVHANKYDVEIRFDLDKNDAAYRDMLFAEIKK